MSAKLDQAISFEDPKSLSPARGRMLSGAVVASCCVAVGSFVQGWDTSAIAGGLLYLVPDLGIETNPQLQGAVISTNLISAVLSAGLSGPASDWLGRKLLLTCSAVFFLLAGIIMAFSRTIYQVLLGRAFVGISNGILVSMAPLYIAEVAPPESRGQLSTLPQLAGSLGLVTAYTMDLIVSLRPHPNWRFMLGAMVVPSAAFLFCMLVVVPESPRWLVSKGRMAEAREVLQKLLNREDVTSELALQVEGLHVNSDATVEEWTLVPAGPEDHETKPEEQEFPVMKVFGGEDGTEWIATPHPHEENVQEETWQPSSLGQSIKSHFPPVDPVVLLLEKYEDMVHANPETPRYPEGGGREFEGDYDDLEEEKIPELEGAALTPVEELESLKVPLLSRREGRREESPARLSSPSRHSMGLSREGKREEVPLRLNSPSRHHVGLSPFGHGRREENWVGPSNLSRNGSGFSQSGQSRLERKHSQEVQSSHGESGTSALQCGGGFLLTYEWEEAKGENGETELVGFKRVFLLEEPAPLVALAADVHIPASEVPGEREVVHTAAIVSSLHMETVPENAEGPATIHPALTATKGPLWSVLKEGGVRHALAVGVGLNILQQGTGISAVLGFAPEIFKDSGADFLEKMGISSDSSSILFSGAMCLLMVPAILVAMRLVDSAGRRQLLLMTAPFVALSMAMLSLVSALLEPGPIRMVLSFLAVAGFAVSFVMGFGPIPAIFCSEIFPTRARGLCLGICIVAQWLGGILVSQSFPLLLVYLGMPAIFGIFVLMTCIAWAFVYVRVPETKGLPLELIIEFFSISAHKEHAE